MAILERVCRPHGAGHATAPIHEPFNGGRILNLVVEQEVFTAALALKEGRGAFASALIGALATKAGCPRTLTFDKAALDLPGFELA